MPVINLDNQQLKTLMVEAPETLLLDVRTPEEFFMLGHIPGARLIPIYELVSQIPTLDPMRKTVVICEHGVRSADASYYLANNGFQQIYQLTAGMAEWDGARSFTETSTTEPPTTGNDPAKHYFTN